jgi:F0F1-type ATP synthase assembly protein I
MSVFDSDFPHLDIHEPDLPEYDYSDTALKDLADDINASQKETEKQLHILIEENRKSERESKRFLLATLIVGILTLVATVIGILV